MLDLTEIATKRTFRRWKFVVVRPPAEVRGGPIHRLLARLTRNAAKNQAWQGGETPANFDPKPKTTTERNTTK
jgi:hypothetical protein